VNSSEQILQLIYEAITSINKMLPRGRRLELSPDTVIIGESAELESIVLVTFMAAVEEGISQKFHQTVRLFDLILTEPDVGTVSAIAERLAGQIDAVAQQTGASAGA
jgi:hypothetical protein